MKAIQIVEFSGPGNALRLVELPEPEPSHMLTPGEGVLIDVHAAGVDRDAGADEVLRSQGPGKDQARELTGGGVDVVIDPVGGERFTDSLRSLGEGGRLVLDVRD